jgi:type IV secretory pathway TraG/TraD family ATPase VirD4
VTGAALASGWSGLALGYATVQVSLLAGLIRGKALWHQYLLSPLAAAPLTFAAGLGISLTGFWMQGPMLGAAICAAAGYGGGRLMTRQPASKQTLERGAVVSDAPAEAARRRAADQRGIILAGIPIPERDEAKHFKLIGTTGTGKSTAIQEILQAALARKDRAVIADPDGGYLQRFYDPQRGDVILNPFDRRSVKWDLFGEIKTSYDVDQLATSLIPDQDGSDGIWCRYARTFFGAVTRQAHQAGITDLGELYRLLVVADVGELRTLVRGTAAQPFLDEHNARMFDSIRSVTSSALNALEYVAEQKSQSLSVRRWVADEQPGVLFIPYKAGQIASLRSMISGWMRLAIFEKMNRDPHGAELREHDERRLWFIVDELDALGQIDGLKDALARLRKFGGRCVLGFQSVAQVSSTYGAGDAHTIVENCGNTLILRCSASEGGGTARFASQLVGEREVTRTTASTSRRFDEWLGSRTLSEHINIEPALLSSQIEQLPDLAGYLKTASGPEWRRVEFAASAAIAPVRGAAPTAATAVRTADRDNSRRHDWGRE